MSYQIYYDRAYIRIGDKFIPFVNSGSNNCFEHGISGRYRCEKSWNVQNWKHPGQFMFTAKEIKEIARDYDQYNQESGMMFKSRHRCFGAGEIERWLINGMKQAFTVEEYVSFGNSFYVLDYTPAETKKWEKHTFKTTDELLSLLDGFKDQNSLEIKIDNNREVYRPKNNKAPRKKLRTDNLPEYYVLKGECNGNTAYLVSLNRRGGFRYLHYYSYSVKPFVTEKDALQYLKKYSDRLGKYNFTTERIAKSA